ncbi:MAG: hypothetical protein Q8R10_15750 [Pseudomonas sp.]|nr:hypothetical protein [Pseudomonas sp.]MDP3847870.1 hypothetical protein [Pseudomonas sp.]
MQAPRGFFSSVLKLGARSVQIAALRVLGIDAGSRPKLAEVDIATLGGG